MSGSDLCTLRIVNTMDESPTLKRVVLSFCDSSRPFSFATGQYVKLSKEGKGESYFAIASAPEEGGRLEFLVRDQEKGFAHELFRMKEADEIASTPPMGKGFSLSTLEGKNITFVACGSGISPIASCIRSILTKPNRYKEIRLFYGERTPSDFAYKEEMREWSRRVKVYQVISRPQGTEWKGLTGHVQDHLKGNVPAGVNSLACLSGMKGMIEDTTGILKELGVPEKNILLNY